jgi:hypothetical protein
MVTISAQNGRSASAEPFRAVTSKREEFSIRAQKKARAARVLSGSDICNAIVTLPHLPRP